VSIYGTIMSIDTDGDDDPGRVSAYTDNRPQLIPTGVGSNRTHVGLAHIPGWCWPTQDGGEDADAFPDAPWLRLSVSAAMPGEMGDWPYVAVNLDLTAAKTLRDVLTGWIDGEHLPDLTTETSE
jgi:hypothetical protein